MFSKLVHQKPLHLLLILWGAVVLAYFQVAQNGFVGDDTHLIEENPDIGDWSIVPQLFLGRTLFQDYTGGDTKYIYYKPLLGLWWKINYTLVGQADPAAFHLTQLGLHAVNSSLVFLLVWGVTQQLNGSDESLPAPFIGFIVGLLWGLHPTNSESVLYIAAGQEPLFFFFGLVSFNLIIWRQLIAKWAVAHSSWSIKRIESFIFMIIGLSWLASLLSKETGILIGLIGVLYLWLAEKHKRWYVYMLLWLTIVSIYFFLRIGLAGISLSHTIEMIPIHRASLTERLLTVPYILFEYLRLLTFPKDLYVGSNVVVRQLSPELMAKVVSLAIVVSGVVWLSWRKPVSRWLIVSGVVSVGLVSNIMPLDLTFSERWLYLPSLFFVWLVVKLVVEYEPQAISLSLIIVGLFIGRIWLRVPNWQSQLTLTEHDNQYQADAYHTKIALAQELAKVGQYERAIQLMHQAIEINPYYIDAYNSMGFIYSQAGNFALAERYYTQAIEEANLPRAWENLAILYYRHNNPRWREIVDQGLSQYPQSRKLLLLKQEGSTL